MENENGRTLAALKEWQKTVNEKLDHISETLDAAFTPEGFCARSRTRLGNLAAMVKLQWFLLAAIVIAIITEALKR